LDTPQTKERGVWLSAWLVLMFLSAIWVAYRYISIIQEFIDIHSPRFTGILPIALYTLIGLAAVNLVCVVGIWNWRKWGVYGIVATSIVALIINFLIGVPFFASLLGLVGLVILWLLVQPKWPHFV